MKKVLSLILALLMSASCASYILADDAAIVDEAAVEAAVEEEVVEEEKVAGPYDAAIEFLASKEIFKGGVGLSDEDIIQRYQMALFVGRISTGWVNDDQWEDGPENWSEFTDIGEEPANKYLGALSYANSKGIIQGYGNGKFGPTDSITYQNALTMVVRTLGYTTLDWPWGYIEKANELGLTEGIDGVAYTEELTRGEVAQIIYNALFAATAKGDTLGMRNFGVAYGWQEAVIVASNLDKFVKLDKTPAASLVAFKLLEKDGVTLGEETYFAKAADFGLSGDKKAHDDEAAVGHVYNVYFQLNDDSEIVSIVGAEEVPTTVYKNTGKLNDYEVKAYLADMTLVDKYSDAKYFNVTASTKDEIVVYDAIYPLTESKFNKNYFRIDFATGNILVPAEKDGKFIKVDKDGKEELVKDIADATKYVAKYFYNDILDRYYEVEDAKADKLIGINWITDAEMKDILSNDKYIKWDSVEVSAFPTFKGEIANTAYSDLTVFETEAGLHGLYESYRLGIYEDTWKCGDGHENAVNRIEGVKAWKAITGEDAKVAGANAFAEGATLCDHAKKVKEDSKIADTWFTDDSIVPEDGDYVIYNYKKSTGAIKVVKVVNEETDGENDYIATGVVRGYSTSSKKIAIGEDTFSIGAYPELAGNAFEYAEFNTEIKEAFNNYFRTLVNQFVTYTVIDGEIVDIKRVGASGTNLIVVDSYAGLSSDGYIVVNGYSTDNFKYEQFRIGSYDSWMKGDFFYNYDKADIEEAFAKGTVYAISSYDAEIDVYYVQIITDANGCQPCNDEPQTLIGENEFVALGKKSTFTVDTDDYNYLKITEGDDVSYIKLKSSQKYIVVPATDDVNENNNLHAPIYVFEGKLPTDWSVTGQRVGSGEDKFVIVNATGMNGFSTASNASVVLVQSNKKLYDVDYNGAFAGEDWYLLGATEVKVEVFDLLTGKSDLVSVATNVKLVAGKLYVTYNNVIVDENYVDFWGVNALVSVGQNLYTQPNEILENREVLDSVKYIIDNTIINKDEDKVKLTLTNANKDDIFDKKAFGSIITNRIGTPESYKVNDIAFFTINEDDNGKFAVESIDKKNFEKLVDGLVAYSYDIAYVYDTVSRKAVVYIDLTGVSKTVETKTTTDPVVFVKNYKNQGVDLMAEINYTETKTDNKIDKIVADSVKIYFDGVVDVSLKEIIDDGLFFPEFTLAAKVDFIKGEKWDIINEFEAINHETFEYYKDEDGKDTKCVKSITFDIIPTDGKEAVISGEKADIRISVGSMIDGHYTPIVTLPTTYWGPMPIPGYLTFNFSNSSSF